MEEKMPNWTMNTLKITETTEAVSSFKEFMGEDNNGFCFKKLVPPPNDMFEGNLGEKERAECEKKNITNWYDWQCENWDTKWNACDVTSEEETFLDGKWTTITYQFNTAWSPPLKVIDALKKKFPDLEISGGYIDEGYEGCGSFYDVGS
tara:strand:- start:399 stop:845 length:447 start_codon:yes stop_codon:yes gene_type:complete